MPTSQSESACALQSTSLNEVAVNFITEAIESVKSETKPSSTVKLELAARQKRLEQHISETKTLMGKLAQAKSKQEKDAIMAILREMSRCVFALSVHLRTWVVGRLSSCQFDGPGQTGCGFGVEARGAAHDTGKREGDPLASATSRLWDFDYQRRRRRVEEPQSHLVHSAAIGSRLVMVHYFLKNTCLLSPYSLWVRCSADLHKFPPWKSKSSQLYNASTYL
jgi:hypothetical protein